MSDVLVSSDALVAIAGKVARLAPSRVDPEAYFVGKSEVMH